MPICLRIFFGCFHNMSQRLSGGKAGNIYQSVLSSKSLPPLLWGVDLSVCWKQGGGPLEVPAQERQRAQTQVHKAASLASRPARLMGW